MTDLTEIHIRWNNEQDLLLTVSLSKDSISSIKQRIRKNAPEHTAKKTIRLLHRGQLLNKEQHTLSDYNIKHQERLFIHCALSDPIIPTNHINDSKNDSENKKNGFNKLRESGYNDEEIRSIRTQFHQSHNTPNYIDGELPSDEILELEEQWMLQTGDMLPEGSAQGTFKEMLCGLLLGFFLGVLCLFWVRESVFTRRHQMGIMAGMLINLSCGVIHVYY